MELERPHHLRSTTTTTSSTNSELFICFTSRLSSSSSMKIAKSILSPGRARDPPVSLSTSLSRRLRTNGSIKGGQASPMFPTGGKKRGCAFENPEPSSPKVTCIGQVRVKTKKKAKQTRSLSRRRSGEVSFRKVEQAHDVLSNNDEVGSARTQRYAPANSSAHFQQQESSTHRNQRWVHLPVTICEALRAFGAEFSCLFPCRPSCFSTNEREKEEKANAASREEQNGQSSCGAVFARWFVALQDCEGRQGRQIELVVGGDEERTEVRERTSMRSSRRHVFEDIEFKEEIIEVKGEGEGEGEEEEKARVSICIPPKNALLLMRCRSDPMKMADLANRFWESPAPKDEDEQEEDDEVEDNYEEITNQDVIEQLLVQDSEATNDTNIEREEENEAPTWCVSTEISGGELENQEKDANLATEVPENEEEKPEGAPCSNAEVKERLLEETSLKVEEVPEPNLLPIEARMDQEVAKSIENSPILEMEKEERSRPSNYTLSPENFDTQDAESETEEETLEPLALEAASEEENVEEESSIEEESQEQPPLQENENEAKQTTTHLECESEGSENAREEEEEERDQQENENSVEGVQECKKLQIHAENEEGNKGTTTSSNVLPDCLLLMMCEPKLSMEVSKETWVCSTDFIRWLPDRHPAKKVNLPDEPKKRVSTDSNHGRGQQPAQDSSKAEKKKQQQMLLPPRSSCSLPAAAAAVSMATMIEQKLVNAVGYEPFVLTRCKSEPMRTAAAKLVPDACFWNNRKLEPHRGATFGVGAAGVGF